MDTDMRTAIRRLELAIAFLSRCEGDWFEAWDRVRNTEPGACKDDWDAIADLIVVATHGAPDHFSYVGPDFLKGRKDGKEADPF